jgi:hypothetical protein
MPVETEYALRQTYSVTTDGNGNGSVVVGPSQAFTRWKLTRYSVVATLPTGGQVIFTLYRGTSSQGQVIDFTRQGWGDTSDQNEISLSPGEYVTGVWSGTTPGTAASLTIEGTNYVRGKRSY